MPERSEQTLQSCREQLQLARAALELARPYVEWAQGEVTHPADKEGAAEVLTTIDGALA